VEDKPRGSRRKSEGRNPTAEGPSVTASLITAYEW
jgi:hypothetical protein